MLNGKTVLSKRNRLNSENKKEAEIQANDSSEKTHRFFLAYVFLLSYVLVIVSSTTDLQLLLEDKGIVLPILNVNVSLVGFYVIAPILITAVHINLLLHSSITYSSLKYLSLIYSKKVPNIKVKNNILDIAILGKDSSIKRLYQALANILYIYSSPIVLSIILFRFSDYQSTPIFCLHILMIMIDFIFIIYFGRLQQKTNTETGHCNNPIGFPFGDNKAIKCLIYLFFSLLIIKIVVCWDVFIRDWRDSVSKDIIYHYYNVTDDDGSIDDLYGFLPIIKIDRTTKLSKEEDSNYFGSLNLKKDTSSLHSFINRGMSIDLRNRSLRYAALPMQNLARAWFTNSDLQGANLLLSQLQGVVLNQTQLQGSNLSGSNLDGAYVFNANLTDANLRGATIRGAIFDDSNLTFTNLEESDLTSSVFTGNTLISTILVKADLSSSFLANNYYTHSLMPEGEIAIFDIDFNREPFILNVISEKDINYHLKEISSSKELFLQIVHAEDKRDPRKLVIRDSNRANYKIMTKLCKNTNKLNNLVALDYIFGKLTLIDYEQSKNLFNYLKKHDECKNAIIYLEENDLAPI
ncbi:TPA: pentapeptide repeat-containing protein [Klebsiella pneumoniae]